jgi:hypothetical protein
MPAGHVSLLAEMTSRTYGGSAWHSTGLQNTRLSKLHNKPLPATGVAGSSLTAAVRQRLWTVLISCVDGTVIGWTAGDVLVV